MVTKEEARRQVKETVMDSTADSSKQLTVSIRFRLCNFLGLVSELKFYLLLRFWVVLVVDSMLVVVGVCSTEKEFRKKIVIAIEFIREVIVGFEYR